MQAAGRQARRWDTGDERFRRDFESVFQANPLWSSFNAIQSLAGELAPMTNHHEEPAPLPALVWTVVFTILLVAAVAIFALVLVR